MAPISKRSIDDGGIFLLHEQDPPPACGRAVCVETRFDEASDPSAITLSLRRAEHHDGGPTHVNIERATASFSLTTGRCAPVDAPAEQLLAEHAWLEEALRTRLEWLRERAKRQGAQKDRTTCFVALQRAEPGLMIPHDTLFPSDWDLLFQHEGETYWAVDHHCSNAACSCEEIVVELHRITSPETRSVGNLRIDFAAKPLQPKASSVVARSLFKPLWSKHGAELLRRYGEVRRDVHAHAHDLARGSDSPPRDASPARNAPCPCGSGKKYKRCCADRDLAAARALAAKT